MLNKNLLNVIVITIQVILVFTLTGCEESTYEDESGNGKYEGGGIYNGFHYTYQGAEVTITGYDGNSGTVIIPNEIDGRQVTSIHEKAFSLSKNIITAITIPANIKSIAEKTFTGCINLTDVTFVEGFSMTIGKWFSGLISLTSVAIPASVTSISSSAFSGCTSLVDVTFASDSLLETINESMFSGCTSLEIITIPASVMTVGSYAFSKCTSLTSITIPEGVKSIGISAFSDCSSLTSINIPEGVASIGGSAFSDTAWLKNQSNGLVYAGKVLYIYKGVMPDITEIDNIKIDTIAIAGEAFSNCTSLTSIVIPESVTSIGNGAFSKCTNLISITIPASVTTIDSYAFSSWTSSQTITVSWAENSKPSGWSSDWKAYCSAKIIYNGGQ